MASRLTVDPEKLEALARYNKALELRHPDPKVTKLAKRADAAAPGAAPAAPKKRGPYRKREKDLAGPEKLAELLELNGLKPLTPRENLPPYDVTRATRYPDAPMWNKKVGAARLEALLQRYSHVMKPQGITGGEFRNWREYYMLLTPEQLGTLVRVSARTIRSWENGDSEIPFAMWWVMHTTLQDPEYFLTRPGFHDFYIEYTNGEAVLCSYKWPDIRCTPTNLYFNQSALSEVSALRQELKQKDQAIAELTAENTRLRQMMKAGTVAVELQAMHEHIGDMLKRISTADVLPFQDSRQSADVVLLSRQAQA